MNLTILGATGATGRELTRQALERGHTVTAIARVPNRIPGPPSDRLTRVAADAQDAGSIARAVHPGTTVLSGLGISKGSAPDVYTSGARAVLAAAPERILWLGAYGTGPTATAAGWLTRTLLRVFVMRGELPDRASADRAVLAAGGTVFHPGPLSLGAVSGNRRTVDVAGAPKRVFPARVSRATVAAAMLDEAETPRFPGSVAIPLER